MSVTAPAVLAAASAAGVAALALRPGPRGLAASVEGGDGIARVRLGQVPWPLVAVLGVWVSGLGLLAAVLAAAVTSAVLRARRRSRGVRRRQEQERRAVEACGVLVDELRAGHPPVQALASAAEVDEVLTGVSRVAGAGSDVPSALRATDVEAYRAVAAAWQVAERHGAGLAGSVRRVVTHLRADLATDRVVRAELASARSTAHLLLALPVLALLGGAASGGRPWQFLLATPWGAGCLVLGSTLSWLGLRWIAALAAGVRGR